MTKLLNVIHTFDNYREALESDPKEKLLKRIRKWRDAELAASDWTQIEDSSADKIAWAKYRKSLRDLPASKDNPFEIELPEKP